MSTKRRRKRLARRAARESRAEWILFALGLIALAALALGLYLAN